MAAGVGAETLDDAMDGALPDLEDEERGSERGRKNNSPVVVSMADLAAAMDDVLLVSVSFHQRRRTSMEGEGSGLECHRGWRMEGEGERRSPDL